MCFDRLSHGYPDTPTVDCGTRDRKFLSMAKCVAVMTERSPHIESVTDGVQMIQPYELWRDLGQHNLRLGPACDPCLKSYGCIGPEGIMQEYVVEGIATSVYEYSPSTAYQQTNIFAGTVLACRYTSSLSRRWQLSFFCLQSSHRFQSTTIGRQGANRPPSFYSKLFTKISMTLSYFLFFLADGQRMRRPRSSLGRQASSTSTFSPPRARSAGSPTLAAAPIKAMHLPFPAPAEASS